MPATELVLDVRDLRMRYGRNDVLSGGQRRRLDVAIGIVGRPELLFLDEPTAGFDPEARREFHDLVHRLADREEATILLTTHDLDEAERLADRILVLAGGTIIADGSADELSRRMSTRAEVRWSRDGQRLVHPADEPTRFVRQLFRQYGESIEDLELRRASLEDTYMALVRQAESGAGLAGDAAIRNLADADPRAAARAAGHPADRRRPRIPVPQRAERGPADPRDRRPGRHLRDLLYPITHLPHWLQWAGQVFPMYWLGLGTRSALLPASLASVEIGHSWRHLATFGVLGAWTVAGLLIAPLLLSRVARRESGSSVAARRERAMRVPG